MIGAMAVVRECLRSDEPAVLATVVELSPEEPVSTATTTSPPAPSPTLGAKIVVRLGTTPLGSFGEPRLDETVLRDALDSLATGQNTVRSYPANGDPGSSGVTVFYEVFTPPPRMVVVGSTDFTAALVRVAKILGYRVTVCDARTVFATALRFPEADEVVAVWPDRYLATVADRLGPRDAVCVLSHDLKFDVPAILAVLDSRVGYIGAMGSRRSHAERIERLRDSGVADAKLSRVMGPIGIDIGARTPEETAVAIVAEIIALRASIPVPSLRDGSGPIHHARA